MVAKPFPASGEENTFEEIPPAVQPSTQHINRREVLKGLAAVAGGAGIGLTLGSAETMRQQAVLDKAGEEAARSIDMNKILEWTRKDVMETLRLRGKSLEEMRAAQNDIRRYIEARQQGISPDAAYRDALPAAPKNSPAFRNTDEALHLFRHVENHYFQHGREIKNRLMQAAEDQVTRMKEVDTSTAKIPGGVAGLLTLLALEQRLDGRAKRKDESSPPARGR